MWTHHNVFAVSTLTAIGATLGCINNATLAMPVWASVEHTLATECTLVRVSGAVTATFHSLGGACKQQKHIVSQLWRLEVRDRADGRFSSFRGLSPRLAGGCPPPMCQSVSSSLLIECRIGVGPSPVTSFCLNYLCKDPRSKYSHILR